MGVAVGNNFSPNLRLCNAETMRLKTRQAGNLDEEFLWSTMTYGIEYAVRADPECSSYQKLMLDELDKVACKLTTGALNDRGKTFLSMRGLNESAASWTWTRSEFKLANTFLAFAAQCQLDAYVQSTLSDQQKSGTLSPPALSQLLYLATNHYKVFRDFKDRRSICHARPSLRLVRSLLEFGANPNEGYNTTSTAWEAVLTDHEFGYDTIEQFLRHGADPRAYGAEIKCSAEPHLKQLLKEKKRETRWDHYSGRFGWLGH